MGAGLENARLIAYPALYKNGALLFGLASRQRKLRTDVVKEESA